MGREEQDLYFAVRHWTIFSVSEILDISRVVWIGGGSGAGKTSVAMSLAFRYDLAFYRIDARAYEHRDRLIERGLVDDDPEKSHDLRWLEPDPADMAQGFVDTSRHLIPLILDDLSALDPKVGVVVEGPQLFPSLVAPYLASPRHGAWLLPTPEFRRRALESRSTGAAKFTRDPERALENLLTRNALLDAQTRAEGETLDLRLFEVDGSDDPPTMAERVGAHLCVAQLPSGAVLRSHRARRGLRHACSSRLRRDAAGADACHARMWSGFSSRSISRPTKRNSAVSDASRYSSSTRNNHSTP